MQHRNAVHINPKNAAWRPAVDRLTFLPDTILVDIISLLSTKTAVSTSVLSTRWRYLWTQLTNLSLDCRHFPQHTADFYPVVDQLLTRLPSSLLGSFTIRAPYPRQRQFELWLRHLCTRNIQNIDITLEAERYGTKACTSSPFTLAPSIFRIQSLKRLILPPSCLDYDLPCNTDFICKLPNLIKLELGLRASQCGFLAKLVRFCPLLEHLVLTAAKPWNNESQDGVVIDISCENLRRLSLDLFSAAENTKVVIDVPKLQWFYLAAYRLPACSLVRKPTALHEATIIVTSDAPILSLLPVISNVRVLRIYVKTLGMLENYKDNQGNSLMFHKIVELTLSFGGCTTRDALNHFPFESTSSILLLHVKRIRVKLFKLSYGENLKKLAEFLLRNAPALRLTFEVIPSDNQSDDKETNKLNEMLICIDLYSCSRKFSKCPIDFRGHRVKFPTNDEELQELKGSVGLLQKFLALKKIISEMISDV